MNLVFVSTAQKAYQKLPLVIQQKADRVFNLLLTSPAHPSLRLKKMKGSDDRWEVRIDYHYRFTCTKATHVWIIRTIGPHDAGLGKK